MKKVVIVIICIILLLALGLGIYFLTNKGEKKEENIAANNSQSMQKSESTTNTKTSNNKKYEYTYRDGVLTQIVDEKGNPKQTDFVIDGIILVGNRHEYSGDDTTIGIMDYLVEKGYKKEGLNKDFYLNEWIEFYIDTKYSKNVSDVKILVTPHKTVEELEKMSLSQLEELASEKGGFVIDYQTPEEDNHKYVGNGYVNQDYPEGKYDILFTYKGKLAYFININETKEP